MEFTNDNERRLYEIISNDIPELQKFLFHIFLERGQLYGALAHLMNLTETEQFHIDNETRKVIHDSYMVYFIPDEDQEGLTVEIHERRNIEEDGGNM